MRTREATVCFKHLREWKWQCGTCTGHLCEKCDFKRDGRSLYCENCGIPIEKGDYSTYKLKDKIYIVSLFVLIPVGIISFFSFFYTREWIFLVLVFSLASLVLLLYYLNRRYWIEFKDDGLFVSSGNKFVPWGCIYEIGRDINRHSGNLKIWYIDVKNKKEESCNIHLRFIKNNKAFIQRLLKHISPKTVIDASLIKKYDIDKEAISRHYKVDVSLPTKSLPKDKEQLHKASEHFNQVLKFKPVLTYFLCSVNLLIFLWAFIYQGGIDKIFYQYGKINEFIFFHHEYYRLFTSIFLHLNFEHILLNIVGLYLIGSLVEKLFGYFKFLYIYIASGLIASFCSLIFMPNPSIGASGAIMGLMGAAFILYVKYGKVLTLRIKELLLLYSVSFSLGSIFYGYFYESIDNAAHLGGFLAGMLLAVPIRSKILDDASDIYYQAISISGSKQSYLGLSANRILRKQAFIIGFTVLFLLSTVCSWAMITKFPQKRMIYIELLKSDYLSQVGKLEKAVSLSQKTLKNSISQFGMEAIVVAEAFANTGKIYLRLNDLDSAQIYIEDALKIYDFKLKDKNKKKRRILNLLAEVYSDQKNYEKAKDIIRRSIGKKKSDYQDIVMTDSYYLRSRIDLELKEYDAAWNHALKASFRYKDVYGKNSIQYLRAQAIVASIMIKKGEMIRAEKLLNDILKQMGSATGRKKSDILFVLDGLIEAYKKLDWKEQLALSKRKRTYFQNE